METSGTSEDEPISKPEVVTASSAAVPHSDIVSSIGSNSRRATAEALGDDPLPEPKVDTTDGVIVTDTEFVARRSSNSRREISDIFEEDEPISKQEAVTTDGVVIPQPDIVASDSSNSRRNSVTSSSNKVSSSSKESMRTPKDSTRSSRSHRKSRGTLKSEKSSMKTEQRRKFSESVVDSHRLTYQTYSSYETFGDPKSASGFHTEGLSSSGSIGTVVSKSWSEESTVPVLYAESDNVFREPKGRDSVMCYCVYCRKQVATFVIPHRKTKAYVVFIILLVLFVWPFCLIPLLLKRCEVPVHYCTLCKAKLSLDTPGIVVRNFQKGDVFYE